MAYGLSRALEPGRLLVAVNTGDDFAYLGLSVSPDLDTVCYTLAELEDQERGWGRVDETWHFMDTLAGLGQPGWFRLGDRDLAMHVLRTQMLSAGEPLSVVTRRLCEGMNIGCRVIPVTDDRVETFVETAEGPLAFQDYFVRQQCRPVVTGFDYRGAADAAAHPQLLESLSSPELEAIVFCPSNPWLSMAPILAIKEISAALLARRVPLIVVSPIVGGRAIKGPAAKLMSELGLEVSALQIARHYAHLADTIVVDHADADLKAQLESTGVRALVTSTVMNSRDDRVRLAREILAEVAR